MPKHYYRWIVNNWVHDVGTGLWAAALFVLWRLEYYGSTVTLPPAAEALRVVSYEMFVVMLLSLAVIFVTGGVRLRYWRNENTPDELPYKRRSLFVKHALYLVVYGFGTLWAWALQR